MINKILNTSQIDKVLRGRSFSTYGKISEKLTFLTPLIRTPMCAYQRVRNVSFSENFAYVLNEWFLKICAMVSSFYKKVPRSMPANLLKMSFFISLSRQYYHHIKINNWYVINKYIFQGTSKWQFLKNVIQTNVK